MDNLFANCYIAFIVLVYLACCALTVVGASAPVEVWLTPERAAALTRVTSRPYVISQERIGDNTVVYHWTNGLHDAVTTQSVVRVLGNKSSSAWQDKLDAADLEKKTILDDLKAVKDKPTKSSLDAIIKKHEK